MARLIDTDALRLMKVEECAGHSIEYAMGWKACIEYIKSVPAAPAIPMEWLEWQIMNAKYNKIKEGADTFEFVLKCWKEQETRDEPKV